MRVLGLQTSTPGALCLTRAASAAPPLGCVPTRSDGTQPHQVHITFQRKVELVVRPARSTCPDQRRLTTALRAAQELALYVDFKADESYTPKHVSIRVGNSAHDVKVRLCRGPIHRKWTSLLTLPALSFALQEVRLMTLDEPIGWVHISLLPPPQRCVASPCS